MLTPDESIYPWFISPKIIEASSRQNPRQVGMEDPANRWDNHTAGRRKTHSPEAGWGFGQYIYIVNYGYGDVKGWDIQSMGKQKSWISVSLDWFKGNF